MVESTETQIIEEELKELKEQMKSLSLLTRKVTPLERFAVAPMVDISDRFFRYFMRLLTKRSFLYTEMLNEHAILYSKHGRDVLLKFSDNQHPVVCQIGGNDPEKMAMAAKICEDFGYDEVNVNCGCPSSRTTDGCFGAVLMFEPKQVAAITKEMMKAVSIPVTVKCRLGVDDMDKYEDVKNFIDIVSTEGGVNKFIVHARKCLLQGLSPHENRTVPPLKYDWVLNLKKDFPHLRFVINGGFVEAKEILTEENGLEGCMAGRMAYYTPWELAKVDRDIYGDTEDSLNREEIIKKYADYAQWEQEDGLKRGERIPSALLVKPVIHLFTAEFEGGAFRKHLVDLSRKSGKPVKEVLLESLEFYRGLNPEGLQTRNGIKVFRPQSFYEQLGQHHKSKKEKALLSQQSEEASSS